MNQTIYKGWTIELLTFGFYISKEGMFLCVALSEEDARLQIDYFESVRNVPAPKIDPRLLTFLPSKTT